MDINIAVKNKTPVYAEQAIVCNNSDYTVTWDLDEEWSEYDTKTMRCVYMDGTYADAVFSGAMCSLPVIAVPGVVQVGLYAGDIRTSRMAVLRALPSALTSGGAPADPPESVYNQLMEMIKGMGGASEEDIAKAVASYLTEHPVTETDPTVPEWAKAASKPTYTATEVGALSADTLQAATDAALAQAKASGEFNGENGKDGSNGITPTIGDNGNWYLDDTDTGKPSRGDTGDTGPQGPKGDSPVKGTDYWTAADKQEIVNSVIAALPDGTEVSY